MEWNINQIFGCANVKTGSSVEEAIQRKYENEKEREEERCKSEEVVLDAKSKPFFSSSSYLEYLATQQQ